MLHVVEIDAYPIPAYFFRRAAALHRADGRRGPVVLLDLDPAAVRRIGRTQFAFQSAQALRPGFHAETAAERQQGDPKFPFHNPNSSIISDKSMPQKGIGIHPLDFVFFTHHAGFQHDFARHGRSSGTRRKGPHGT